MNRELTELGIHVHMSQPFDDVLGSVKTALKTEGFGVLTEIDIKATLKQKIGVDFRRYVILGACNPPLAHRALTTNLDVGLLLPCNVVVYEADDNSCVVSLVDPVSMLSILPDDSFTEVAQDARQRLQRVAASLSAQ